MNIEQINDRIDETMTEILNAEFVEATREQKAKFPLDIRARPSKLWYSEDGIVILTQDERTLNYYGGFEYIDKEHRSTVGNYVIFSAESSRIRHVLCALGVEVEVEEDEE